MSIGAVGGAGPSLGAGMSAAPVAAAPATSGASTSTTSSVSSSQAASPSTQAAISAAAQKAMATDNQQVGVSFSISTDGTGHHYAGNVDANGFSINVAEGAAGGSNAHRLDDLVAAVLLALLLQDKSKQ